MNTSCDLFFLSRCWDTKYIFKKFKPKQHTSQSSLRKFTMSEYTSSELERAATFGSSVTSNAQVPSLESLLGSNWDLRDTDAQEDHLRCHMSILPFIPSPLVLLYLKLPSRRASFRNPQHELYIISITSALLLRPSSVCSMDQTDFTSIFILLKILDRWSLQWLLAWSSSAWSSLKDTPTIRGL